MIKRMIEQKMAGQTGVASMLGTRRSSVIRSRALKAAVLGTIETAVEANEEIAGMQHPVSLATYEIK